MAGVITGERNPEYVLSSAMASAPVRTDQIRPRPTGGGPGARMAAGPSSMSENAARGVRAREEERRRDPDE